MIKNFKTHVESKRATHVGVLQSQMMREAMKIAAICMPLVRTSQNGMTSTAIKNGDIFTKLNCSDVGICYFIEVK